MVSGLLELIRAQQVELTVARCKAITHARAAAEAERQARDANTRADAETGRAA